MAKAEESIRIRVPLDLKRKWDKVVEDHKLSHQAASLAMVAWVVDLDPLMRSMIFGQVPGIDNADLAKLVLKRLAGSKRKG